MKLYSWQRECLQAWETSRFRGIVHVVTGGGKTFLALNAMDRYTALFPDARVRIVVPTIPLAQQWQLALLHHVQDPELRPGFYGGGLRDAPDRRVMIYVVNSARDALSRHIRQDLSLGRHVLLICDECHHYQSPRNRRIFDFSSSPAAFGEQVATLGLSATPFGTGNDAILTRVLGPEIYRYDVSSASSDGIVSSFSVCETAVSFLPSEQRIYRQLSREIMLLLQKLLTAHPELKTLSPSAFLRAVTRLARAANMNPEVPAAAFLLKTWQRKEICSMARSRILCGLSLIRQLPDTERILIFCERIAQAEQMTREVRREYGNVCAVYHSGMNREARQRNMADFRENRARILISCRCLDEGLDVPDAAVGIVLSSAAVTRQRVQRLGRILRRTEGKEAACLYYLYIHESTEDPAYLPGLEAGTRFSVRFRSQDSDFENDLYVYAAADLLEKSKAAGYTGPQLRELRRCLLEGLVRADYLLSPELQARLAANARTIHEHNYRRVMQKMGQYFRRKKT